MLFPASLYRILKHHRDGLVADRFADFLDAMGQTGVVANERVLDHEGLEIQVLGTMIGGQDTAHGAQPPKENCVDALLSQHFL